MSAGRSASPSEAAGVGVSCMSAGSGSPRRPGVRSGNRSVATTRPPAAANARSRASVSAGIVRTAGSTTVRKRCAPMTNSFP